MSLIFPYTTFPTPNPIWTLRGRQDRPRPVIFVAVVGPTAVEYALVLALIVVACIVAITALGSGVTKSSKKYSKSAVLMPLHRSDAPGLPFRTTLV